MKFIPNLITCLNLLSGSLACVMALKFNHYTGAFFFIALAALFDYLDGWAARLLKAASPMGVELDSLADVISFGLAPACVLYAYLSGYTQMAGLPLAAFLLPVFSALRLARFNTDKRQSQSFLGLPVPASGLFWAALIPSVHHIAVHFSIYVHLTFLVVLLIAFCLLMVSEIPMFSLKMKTLRWADNRWPYSLLLLAVPTFGLFLYGGAPLLGISVIIVIYILLSLLRWFLGD
jgi:CDP-diacylglycerol--serine O-phosphatidyltransferase